MKVISQFLLTLTAMALIAAGAAHAQKRQPASDEFPNSIMAPEPGTKPKSQPGKGRDDAGQTVEPAKPKAAPARRRVGSSGPSPLPPPRSVVTPLGVAPSTVEQPRVGTVPAAPTAVPGFSTLPAPPPALSGQTFQDKAIGCVHHGTSMGVGPGQIGAYTGSCVNTR